MKTITFETKVWEKDWRFILQEKYIKTLIDRCQVKFEDRMIMINNVKDYDEVKRKADQLVSKKIIDRYFIVEDYEDEVLSFFNIDKDSFKGGYYYSIAELASLYLCKTEFLLHFSGDSYLTRKSTNWVDEGIKLLTNEKDVLVINPSWDNDYEGARSQAIAINGNFFIGHGFSDQCYLVDVEKFRNINFNEKNSVSDKIYPYYGGELFEKRVDAFMRNNGKMRGTSSKAAYIHANFPNNISKKKQNALFYYYFLFKRLRY